MKQKKIYRRHLIVQLSVVVMVWMCQTGEAFLPRLVHRHLTSPFLQINHDKISQHQQMYICPNNDRVGHHMKYVSLFSTPLSVSDALPKDQEEWKLIGEKIITNAISDTIIFQDDISDENDGEESSTFDQENFDIQWKPGKIIVTINADAFVGNVEKEEENVNELDEDFEELEDDDESSEGTKNGFDIVSIARAINAAFGAEGEGSIGYNIAVHHEIEVTTPGASDELQGIMFEAYKGFDVLLETMDKKKNKRKIVEGKLVERTDESTRLNCKGRMRKFKNEDILSLKLPKAKREKGAR